MIGFPPDLAALLANIGHAPDPLWAWAAIYVADIFVGLLCFVLPRELRRGRQDRGGPYKWISQVFTAGVGIHFIAIPIAALLEWWEIRGVVAFSLLLVFGLSYVLVLR